MHLNVITFVPLRLSGSEFCECHYICLNFIFGVNIITFNLSVFTTKQSPAMVLAMLDTQVVGFRNKGSNIPVQFHRVQMK